MSVATRGRGEIAVAPAVTVPAAEVSGRRIAGAAGVGYVAFVAIENMGLLESPGVGSTAGAIRAAYADDPALQLVTALSGVMAVLLYCVFAAGLVALLWRPWPAIARGWAAVAMVGAAGGAMLAAVGDTAQAFLVAGGGEGLDDGLVRVLYELGPRVQSVAAGFVALFLLGVGRGALRSGGMPRPLAWAACALGGAMACVPATAFTDAPAAQVTAFAAYGVLSLWILLVALWLVVDYGAGGAALLRRGAFLLVAVVAGLVGVALLAVPRASGSFFAWGLAPPPLAALAGGLYVGAAVAYGLGVRAPWRAARPLAVAMLVLSVSVLTVTLVHLEVFDFGRLQAWTWIALFAGFSLASLAILALHRAAPARSRATPRRTRPTPPGDDLPAWSRAILTALAAALLALAALLWAVPDTSPFALPPFGGRFIGCWAATLSVLAAWSAVQRRGADARFAVLGLLACLSGALVAAVRTLGDLPPGDGGAYVTALALALAAVACPALRLHR